MGSGGGNLVDRFGGCNIYDTSGDRKYDGIWSEKW